MSARKLTAAFAALALAASPVSAARLQSGVKVGLPSMTKTAVVPALPVLKVDVLRTPEAFSPLKQAVPADLVALPQAAALSPMKALEAVGQAAVPVAGAVQPAALERAWDHSAAPKAADLEPPSVAASVPGLSQAAAPVLRTPSAKAPARRALVPGLSRAAGWLPFAAASTPAWLSSTLQYLEPYLIGAGVLAGAFVVQKLVRLVVGKLAKRGNWNPNATDTVRFIATLATWLGAAGVGMHLAGVATGTILATFGLIITLAVRSSVSNLVQAVILLVQRPFVIGEKVRVGESLYQVEDMTLQYVKMRSLGKLVKDAPERVPANVTLKPLAEVDPLGRSVDEKGFKFVLVPNPSPNPAADGEDARLYSRFQYTTLGAKAVTLFRPYARDHAKLEARRLRESLNDARRPVAKLWSAVTETGSGPLWRAFLWMALAGAATFFLPALNAWLGWKLLGLALPYLKGLGIMISARYVAAFLGALTPKILEKFGRTPQAAVVARLLIEIAVWSIGLAAALSAIGVEWEEMATSLGVTAAAVTVATNDVLKNLAQAVILRLNRPFNIGQTIRVKGETGIVEEMGMFYVVLKPAEGLHTVVPYGAIDGDELETYEPEPKTK